MKKGSSLDVRRLCLRPQMSTRDAAAVIDREAVRIALITDEELRLLGTVTDGDIRRALLRGDSLDTPVEAIMHRNFRWLSAQASEGEALALMRREKLHQVPGLDGQGRVVRLFLIEDLISPRKLPNRVVIMAGGKGERLGALTRDLPKPMLPVNGKPLLEIILQQCVDAGFCNFYFAVNYLKEKIRSHFADGSKWHVNIQYLEEDRPLGTAGALSLLPDLPEDPVLVLNGDVLTRVEYARLLQFHAEHSAAATMCVREHTTQIPYGVVRMDDLHVLTLEEKPVLSHYVNAGIYVIEPEVLALVPGNHQLDMPQLLERAVTAEHRVTAFPIHEYWLDVGLPETLERAHGEWE
ncbi:MAG: nucleotidyltransferase family protein [Gammaproteobacteria bacterium]